MTYGPQQYDDRPQWGGGYRPEADYGYRHQPVAYQPSGYESPYQQQRPRRRHNGHGGWIVAAVIAAVVALGLAAFVIITQLTGPGASNAASGTQADACPWKMDKSTPPNGSWTGAVDAIRNATTQADAHAALNSWLNTAKKYPTELATASWVFDGQKVDANKLIDTSDCATPDAVKVYDNVQSTLAAAQAIPTDAPAWGYNSGTHAGAVYFNSAPGITGNLVAIKVVTQDNRTVYVLARCGNLVTPGKPPVTTVPPVTHPSPTPTPSKTPSCGSKCSSTHPGCSSNNCNTKPSCGSNCQTTPGCTSNCETTPGCTSNCQTTPGCSANCGTPTPCNCEHYTPPPAPAPSTPGAENPTPPASQPTQPASTSGSMPPTNGDAGGGTTNPIVSGTPTPVDTGTYTQPPIPTPTGGPFG